MLPRARRAVAYCLLGFHEFTLWLQGLEVAGYFEPVVGGARLACQEMLRAAEVGCSEPWASAVTDAIWQRLYRYHAGGVIKSLPVEPDRPVTCLRDVRLSLKPIADWCNALNVRCPVIIDPSAPVIPLEARPSIGTRLQMLYVLQDQEVLERVKKREQAEVEDLRRAFREFADGAESPEPLSGSSIRINMDSRVVILNGQPIPVEHPGALTLFAACWRAGGKRVSSKTLRCECHNTNINRMLNDHLPAPLRCFIRSCGGNRGGYYFDSNPRLG